jgi:hypothetical protein
MPIQFLTQPYFYRHQFHVHEERVHPIRVLKQSPFRRHGNGDPTPDELRDFENTWDECYRNWENSGIRASVIAELEKTSVEKLNRVTKIIGFGTGSFWEMFRLDARVCLLRRAAQHGVIKEMQAYIEKKMRPPGPNICARSRIYPARRGEDPQASLH